MNYYIQGEAAKAEQIKAAFNGKGIYSNCNFTNENYLYYQCDGKVAFCFIGGGLAEIIKTHPDYQELELHVQPKFKVGYEVSINYGGFRFNGIVTSIYGNVVEGEITSPLKSFRAPKDYVFPIKKGSDE